MSLEQKLSDKYQKIANQINDMIPEYWKEVYFYGENNNGGGTVYFFYKNENEGIIYSADIEEIFNINEEEFEESWDTLFDVVGELRDLFVEDEQEPWFSVMIHLTAEGELEVEYDYINWVGTDFGPAARTEYFKKQYLGINPDSKDLAEEIEEIKKYKVQHTN